MIRYLKINSSCNEINYLHEMFLKYTIDVVSIDKTNIDPSFRHVQFHTDGYKFPPFRGYWNKKDEGKITFVGESTIAERLKELEGKISEFICLEFTFSKKKWVVVFAYRPLRKTNEYQ